MSKVGANVELGVSWVPCHGGQCAEKAVEAYPGAVVIRTELNPGEWVPGMLHAGKSNVEYGTKVVPCEKYECLVHSAIGCFGKECMKWVPAADGKIPEGALIGGNAPDGEPQYIARGEIDGEKVCGKVHPSHGVAYFGVKDASHKNTSYEVLVLCDH